ncbi:MAG: hypothetical protein ABIH26_09515 [Candidatus Eisenbacteria bacterium]
MNPPPIVAAMVWLCILWAAVALGAQVIVSRGSGRRDFSSRAGSPGKGVIHSFTAAMMPSRKESARRHPVKYAAGVLLHAGAIFSLASIPLILLAPESGARMLFLCRPLFVLSLIAGLVLVAGRLASRNLRAISAPEDHFAVLAVCGLLGMALGSSVGSRSQLPFLVYAALIFLYLPLGKLRHCVFFFAAKADYGYRLGYRGVYPPRKIISERPHVDRQ